MRRIADYLSYDQHIARVMNMMLWRPNMMLWRLQRAPPQTSRPTS